MAEYTTPPLECRVLHPGDQEIRGLLQHEELAEFGEEGTTTTTTTPSHLPSHWALEEADEEDLTRPEEDLAEFQEEDMTRPEEGLAEVGEEADEEVATWEGHGAQKTLETTGRATRRRSLDI